MTIHKEAHHLANQTVKIASGELAGSEYRIEDWWDRVAGKSWMHCDGNPACLDYAMRSAIDGLPIDNDVVYGKVGIFGKIIHVSQLETATTAPNMTYRHTDDMGEISGFGGGYEKLCQDMLENGVTWLVNNVERRDLKASGFKDVYGIMNTDSDDAKALEKAMMNGIEDCTGAMHQAVLSRLFAIAENGWDWYCAELRKDEAAA